VVYHAYSERDIIRVLKRQVSLGLLRLIEVSEHFEIANRKYINAE